MGPARFALHRRCRARHVTGGRRRHQSGDSGCRGSIQSVGGALASGPADLAQFGGRAGTAHVPDAGHAMAAGSDAKQFPQPCASEPHRAAAAPARALARALSLPPASAGAPDWLGVPAGARTNARAWRRTSRARRSVAMGDRQFLGRKQRDDTAAFVADHHLFLDAGGRIAILGRTVGLERKYHALFDLRWMVERDHAGDDGPLMDGAADTVPEL